MRTKGQHIVRRVLYVDIQGNEEEGGQNERGKMRVRYI